MSSKPTFKNWSDTDLADPLTCAEIAGLHYVSDARPGIRRTKHGRGFQYRGPEGRAVADRATLARIKALVIPPAWKDVWICTRADGHLQVTGRDARGRKQSRYHPRWREIRDRTKYQHMALFAEMLPAIRERVEHDLGSPGLPPGKVLATVVRLLEATLIRIGNSEYARSNHSYGLTTMRRRHVEVHGAKITFSFRGKSGVRHSIDLFDKRIARIVKRCSELPGHELFEYVDSDGEVRVVSSSDVNEYLREITGQHFTAKDFRTWAGSVLAWERLSRWQPDASDTATKKRVAQVIAEVALQLGNTPSVCRKCYVHPAVIETCLRREAVRPARKSGRSASLKPFAALRKEEIALLKLLRREDRRATSAVKSSQGSQ